MNTTSIISVYTETYLIGHRPVFKDQLITRKITRTQLKSYDRVKMFLAEKLTNYSAEQDERPIGRWSKDRCWPRAQAPLGDN